MLSNVRRTMVLAAVACAPLFAASHRNGPLLLEDQTANLNDLYVFRSYETGRSNYLVMSMSVQGFQNPDNGPSYYKFSDSVLYRFNINNQRGLDGNPDMQIDFVFQTTLRPNPTFVSYFGALKGIDDPGIFLYQTYVIVIRNLATNTASSLVKSMPAPKDEKQYKKQVMEVAKQVSAKLGNTPIVCLQSYLAPQVFANWRSHAGL